MFQKNVETVRAIFDAFAEGDREGVAEMFHPDAIVITSVLGGKRVLQGREGLRVYLGVLREEWVSYTIYAEEFRDLGDRVLALGRIVAEKKGGSYRGEAGWLFWLQDGKVRRLEVHTDHRTALEAAGLEQ